MDPAAFPHFHRRSVRLFPPVSYHYFLINHFNILLNSRIVFRNPGVVPRSSDHSHFVEEVESSRAHLNYCFTCWVPRQPHSKHCSSCDRSVCIYYIIFSWRILLFSKYQNAELETSNQCSLIPFFPSTIAIGSIYIKWLMFIKLRFLPLKSSQFHSRLPS